MLTASLLLLFAQETHTTANYTFELEPGTLAVEEYTTLDERRRSPRYVVRLHDPADPDALAPAMSLVTLEVSWTRNRGRLRRQGETYLLRGRLEKAGATLGETTEVQATIMHATLVSDRFRATHADGSEWVYEVCSRAVGNEHLALITFCWPADVESQRAEEVLRVRSTLTSRGWDPERSMTFNMFGIRCELPLAVIAEVQRDTEQAVLSAKTERCRIGVRVIPTPDARSAIAASHSTHDRLVAHIQREIETAEETHTLTSQRPARFAVGEHIARGFISELDAADGTFTAWRADATIAMGNMLCIVTAVIRDHKDRDPKFDLLTDLLASMTGAPVHGVALLAFQDGLSFRHDSGLERQRISDFRVLQWDFKRRGVEHAVLGEIFIELRKGIAYKRPPEERAEYVRAKHRGGGGLSAKHVDDATLLGQSVSGWRSDFIDSGVKSTFMCYSLPLGKRMLVAGFKGPRSESLELSGLLRQVMAGIGSTTDLESARFEDEGVAYDFPPAICTVESGKDGNSSTVTLRKTTMTTRSLPKSGGLLGAPPEIAKALKRHVDAQTIGWALEGSISEPVFGDAGLGALPAKYASVRHTKSDGSAVDYLYMVADTDTRRLWVEVAAAVDDAEAAATMTGVLRSVTPK